MQRHAKKMMQRDTPPSSLPDDTAKEKTHKKCRTGQVRSAAAIHPPKNTVNTIGAAKSQKQTRTPKSPKQKEKR
jgi:hypothetical protein